jgi:UDP-N-acetylglucosamine acyltransferase
MKIHPSAQVSPCAILGDDVEIGPDCVIQSNAVVEGRTILGRGNFVGYGAVIGTPPQDFAWTDGVVSETRIGDGNTFREYVTIHRGSKEGTATVVGDGCFLMVGTHLGHNVRLGNRVIIANNCLLAGYVDVDDGAVLGGGTVFHQFLRIGRLAMVRGGTRFGKDIPPYVSADGENLISGINAVGLRRAGLSAEVRQEIRRAFKLVFRSGLNVRQALDEARGTEWSAEAQAFFDFIAGSKRGVCRANRAAEPDDEA